MVRGPVLAICVVAAALAAWVVWLYNALVRSRTECEGAWAQIDVQLKRRHDLIANLVEVVQGYAAHERQTLEGVIQKRQQAVDARGVVDTAAAENALTASLRQVMVMVEAYPTLKANEHFLSLQQELAGTENRISFTRQYYNDMVAAYNTRVMAFPGNVVAGMFAFAKRDFFEVQVESERQAPAVKLG